MNIRNFPGYFAMLLGLLKPHLSLTLTADGAVRPARKQVLPADIAHGCWDLPEPWQVARHAPSSSLVGRHIQVDAELAATPLAPDIGVHVICALETDEYVCTIKTDDGTIVLPAPRGVPIATRARG